MRLIDADRAIRILNIKQEEWNTPDERWRPEREFGSVLMNLPTVEAEPVKHGKWIKKTNEDTGYHEYYCENCRCVTDKRMFYCGFCGAKIDLED